ncbi:hypothetical protein BDP81DRAFT_54185 [Colletotrichum phormii]|uniref:Uncharacterized protein n=1 Tax=Colletotrichum phormii TaxID=359342 RepID=A0AAI9ZMU2_9PEZI|nr:uncharacterized protein BDP81DRAFT_54185 [Colletotrichum phormii]KAK1634880.1 hypothetical protein BDP81DRAFT_54185 [Colletotrichum phormii]
MRVRLTDSSLILPARLQFGITLLRIVASFLLIALHDKGLTDGRENGGQRTKDSNGVLATLVRLQLRMKEAALHKTTWIRTDTAAISIRPARGRSSPAHLRMGPGRCSRPHDLGSWITIPFSVVGVVSMPGKSLG